MALPCAYSSRVYVYDRPPHTRCCTRTSCLGTGSFKFRGAFNALSQLTDEEREKGVVTHSSGNHGQAVAAAAQAMGGVPAVVVVPKDTPQVKVDAIAGYGAEVVLCEPSQKSRTETSEDIAERSGKILIPPYNHPDVMAGQGTIGLELLQEIPDLDGIVVYVFDFSSPPPPIYIYCVGEPAARCPFNRRPVLTTKEGNVRVYADVSRMHLLWLLALGQRAGVA